MYQKLLLIFQKHDVLDCYSLSHGKESYNEEVRFLIKKVNKNFSSEKICQTVAGIFNDFLDMCKDDMEFAFTPEDFEELSKDIFNLYQGQPVDFDCTEQDRLKCEEVCFEIFALLDELEIPLKEYEKELDLGDGVDIDCLSYPELDYVSSMLQDKLESKEE